MAMEFLGIHPISIATAKETVVDQALDFLF